VYGGMARTADRGDVALASGLPVSREICVQSQSISALGLRVDCLIIIKIPFMP